MKNLIILGAGGHGKVVKEIAEATGEYSKIEFVDDNSSLAIATTAELESLIAEFDSALVSIGNNELRNDFIDMLEKIGFCLPTLIHPSAYVSSSANVGVGTIVEPKVIINSNSTVGKGCIISVGAIIDHDCLVRDYCHINSGAIVKAGNSVASKIKIDAGQIVG